MSEQKELKKHKNLANCKPSEFLKQTNLIRKYAEFWFKLTNFAEIRKHLPDIPEGATDEERKELEVKQGRENFSAMLDSALEEHPEETIGLLALCCFVPISEADNQPVEMYLDCASDLLESEAVMRFFISLARVGLRLGK